MLILAVTFASVGVATVAPAGNAIAADGPAPGGFTPINPTRVLDTRSGLGTPAGALKPHQTIHLAIAGAAGVPTASSANGAASAVVLNLTATQPTTTGNVTAYPDATPLPRTSTVNFGAHQTVANLAVVPLGTDGKIAIYNPTGGTVHLVADISGYYTATNPATPAPGGFTPINPTRVLDTRSGLGTPAGALKPHQTIHLAIAGAAGVPTASSANGAASAVVLNLTATQPTTTGNVTAYPDATPLPRTSTVNFGAHQTVANLAVVPLGTDGKIAIYNPTGGTVHLVADISGYYTATNPATPAPGGFTPINPTRVLDTRSGLGTPAGALKPHQTIHLAIAGAAGVPTASSANGAASAVVLNLTATQPTTTGNVTAYPDATPLPRTSTVNFGAHQTVANLAVVPLGTDGKIAIYNPTGGTVQLVADISGYYTATGPAALLLPAQTTPAPISTSHYPRDPNAFANPTIFANMGAYDTPFNSSGHAYLVLMDIGGQTTKSGVAGVLLSATSIFISDAQLVAGMQAYIAGYAGAQKGFAPVTIAIGTNNDVDVSAASGARWATEVINPLVSYASQFQNLTIAAADDIEPGFSASMAQTQSWLSGYLANTTAGFVFNGSADGCSTIAVGKNCNDGWTAAGLYSLSGGAAPTRIVGLPQVYNSAMPAQWAYISLTGYLGGGPRLSFGGPLTEYNACEPANQPCSSLDGVTAWNLLWRDINADPRTAQSSLPYATDLEINCYLRMPNCD